MIRKFLLAAFVLLALMAAFACSEASDPVLEQATATKPLVITATPLPTVALTASPTSSATTAPRDETRVIRVIDGDTIEIEGGQRVRYIGMDTPEDTSVRECFGEQATRRNRELVEGRLVELERDVSETDRFGRLLRYVWVDGEMVNRVLVAEGLALVATFPPDVKYLESFLELQELARSSGLGLWSACVDAGRVPTSTSSSPGDNCDPSYPDVCIPPPPPDLNCPDILYANFRVVGSDPHGFDGDNDGRACEG